MNSDPPHYFNDPNHWLKRAAEARAMADHLNDLEAKAAMLRIAEDYERLAERAKARASGRESKSK
jgi:hypothetical protein